MDKVSETFDQWAENGRAEKMEREHGRSVNEFLDKIYLKSQFSFLDVGCGNGWVVRKMAQKNRCSMAVGIDKSPKMIRRAKEMKVYPKESYIHSTLESMDITRQFDYIFAMESIYYSKSVPAALQKIHSLLSPGGKFFCGTDFYADNRATVSWPKMMGLQMHLYSKEEWRILLKDAGFKVRIFQVTDPTSRKKWRREFGTLFITGLKPKA